MAEQNKGPGLGWDESTSRPTGLGIDDPAQTEASRAPGKALVKVEDLERIYLELSTGTFARTLAVLGLQEGWTSEDLSRGLKSFVDAIQQSKDNKVKVYTQKVAKKAFAEWFERLTKISAECAKDLAAAETSFRALLAEERVGVARKLLEGTASTFAFKGAIQWNDWQQLLAYAEKHGLGEKDTIETCAKATSNPNWIPPEKPSAETSAPLLQIQVEVLARSMLNFAMEQSGVPLVEDIGIHNNATTPLDALHLDLHLVPDLGEVMTLDLPSISPGEEFRSGPVHYRLPPARLRGIVERERAVLRWTLRGQQGQTDTLASGESDVAVLPYNHWPGLAVPPALLATYVLPNTPVVTGLLQRVRDLLGQRTGDNALSGYQSRSIARVFETVRALYDAVQSLGLSYAEVPASFEKHGQKIRLPEDMLRDQMGSCLDVTVLVAACLEQMGLRPLVVLVTGHALPAVWLTEDRFPEGTVEDASRLRNQIALRQILPFNSSTNVTMPHVPLERAVEVAQSYLADDEAFQCALDIAVLRVEYRPLPLRRVDALQEPQPASGSTLDPSAGGVTASWARPERPVAKTGPAALPPEFAGRFRRWQDRLLDLTLRNKLLNFKGLGAGALPLAVPDLGLFEDLLADQHPFEVLPLPTRFADERDPTKVEERLSDKEAEARRIEDLKKCKLHAMVPQSELFTRARTLARAARADLEEGGANTLYVSIAFLRWFESADEGAEPHFAPLLLYPVELGIDRNRGRVTMQRLSEDPTPNVTLVEKVRRDHDVDLSALLDLEADDSGIAVSSMLDRVRSAIQRMPRWEVVEDAALGLFTFTKFLMWKDLEDNGALFLQNPVVAHIASATSTGLANATPAVDPGQLDGLAPEAAPCVVDADSTQMAAVASALVGKSFVLQGPPGTGKSQTITNLIAGAMAAGKSVLFVSEKMAALEVVSRRLNSVGLGDFCLELHSHKANKKQVIDALGRALGRAERTQATEWSERSAELQEIRGRLNAYAKALHDPRPLGLTFFQAQSRQLVERAIYEVRFAFDAITSVAQSRLRAMTDAVGELAVRATAVSPVAEHPLRETKRTEWTASVESDLGDCIEAALQTLDALDRELKPLVEALGVQGTLLSTHAAAQTARLAQSLGAGVVPLSTFAPSWPSTAARLGQFATLAREDHAIRTALALRWSSQLFALDLRPLASRFQRYAASFFLIAWVMLWFARRALRVAAVARLPDNRTIASDLESALVSSDRQAVLAEERAWAKTVLTQGDESDPLGYVARLEELMARGDAAHVAFVAAVDAGVSLGDEGAERLAQASARTDAGRMLAELGAPVARLVVQLADHESAFAKLLEVQPFWQDRSSDQHRASLRETLTRYRSGLHLLRSFCLYRESVEAVNALGIGPFAEAHAQAQVTSHDLPAVFHKSFLSAWTRAVRDTEPALRKFDGASHHRLVDRFAALDSEYLQLTRRWVVSRLEERLPAADVLDAAAGEPAVLARELRKKIRHMPIRKLFQSVPNLLARLKPCLLMSPLSVAQYLPAAQRRFDLVVFDEASQIGTHDSIGAIARGNQVVIVGDSKQLPPTTFFSRAASDDEALPDETDVEELESVLDEALARQIPQQMLGWHYRSRHQSLIDFSNRHYYEGRLHIFPAAQRKVEGLGVAWHPVLDGVYHSGKSRTNPREAEQLVDHLVETLRRYGPGDRSFGIVTFSMAQQSHIEELLEERRGRIPEIEPHFAADHPRSEPVFVKNLENVQGDERDEILFSIGYARDDQGKLRMHFGPLSLSGGERRLNVAVTRARCQLRVFSTLTYDQIDLSRTTAVGTRHLRNFLEYAARGETPSETTAMQPGGTDRCVEAEIAGALESWGYEVHHRIGCGGYRVDLAVVDPRTPGTYALAIELDGSNYASAQTARDRDRLRRAVLESLGWQVLRVWSTDWWFDAEAQKQRLRVAVEEALAREPAAAIPTPVAIPASVASRELPPAEPSVAGAQPYVMTALASTGADPERFFQPASQHDIAVRILQMVEAEGPVHEEDVARRVASCWGVVKLTARVRGRFFEEVTTLVHRKLLLHTGSFLWSAQVPPETYVGFRQAGHRDAGAIAPEEIANAAAWVLGRLMSLSHEDLARETARVFGFGKMGSKVSAAMDLGIAKLTERDGVRARDGHKWEKVQR